MSDHTDADAIETIPAVGLFAELDESLRHGLSKAGRFEAKESRILPAGTQ